MNDKAILQLFHDRDERAISESKNKYGSYCYTIAYNITGNAEDAEECVMDALLRAWGAIPPAKPDSLCAYLGRITRNLSCSVYRKKNQKKRGGGEMPLALDEIETVFSAEQDLESNYDRKELSLIVNRFLETLSERDRNILLCRYYFVYPVKEIAEKYGEKPNYVDLILSRTLKKFKKFLEKEKYL